MSKLYNFSSFKNENGRSANTTKGYPRQELINKCPVKSVINIFVTANIRVYDNLFSLTTFNAQNVYIGINSDGGILSPKIVDQIIVM